TAAAAAEKSAAAEDGLAVGTANMAFHNAVVSLSDSRRLARSFSNVLAELRLAFLKVEVLDFLHSPFIDRNREIIAAYSDESPAAAAERLRVYLGDSERQVLGAYARAGQDCSVGRRRRTRTLPTMLHARKPTARADHPRVYSTVKSIPKPSS